MPKIFISYRRKDTAPWVGRIYERLTDEMRDSFPEKDVFRDIDNIPPGADFRVEVSQFLTDCDVVLVVIGDLWLSIQDPKTGKRRLDDPDDTLRIEVATALKRGDDCLVIPLLIDGAPMPNRDDLPDDMKDLAARNAHFIDDRSFSHDINGLIQFIKNKFSTQTTPLSLVSQIPSDIETLFQDYEKARDAKRWDEAKKLANTILNSNNIGFYRVIEAVIRDDIIEINEALELIAKQRLEQFSLDRKIKEYDGLRRLFGNDRSRFRTAIHTFSKIYPNYDPDNLYFNNIEYVSKVFDIFPNDSLFEWLRIPSGDVTLTTGGYLSQTTVFQVPEFAISKYPITKAQYLNFVNAPGYNQDALWTRDGLQFRNKNKLTQPQNWEHLENIHHPITGNSWYEAIAFCNWLSELTGENIKLPTEQQWQRAAQGDDNRLYPWGNEWDASRCNHNVGGKGTQGKGTTKVTDYENMADGRNDGRSPFGVADMSGNVVEWCLTGYETGSNILEGSERRCGRGGSWSHDSKESFQVTYRREQSPDFRYNDWGFRIVSLPKNQG